MEVRCPDMVGDRLGEQWGVRGRLLGYSGMGKLGIAKNVDLSLTAYWAKEMHLFGANKKKRHTCEEERVPQIGWGHPGNGLASLYT